MRRVTTIEGDDVDHTSVMPRAHEKIAQVTHKRVQLILFAPDLEREVSSRSVADVSTPMPHANATPATLPGDGPPMRASDDQCRCSQAFTWRSASSLAQP